MKVTLNIPESLDDITLEQYQEFLNSEQTTDDVLSIFLNLSKEDVSKIKASEVDRLVNDITNLFEQKQKHILKFTLNGQRFGFIPNLNEITYGENKDITSYINDFDKMHRAMAVLYRPIKQKQGNKYLIEDYNGTNKYAEFMKQMPLSVVMGSLVFFYNLTNELLNYIPNYIEQETQKQQMSGQISEKNGEIIKNLIPSLKATLEDMTRLQDFHYIRA